VGYLKITAFHKQLYQEALAFFANVVYAMASPARKMADDRLSALVISGKAMNNYLFGLFQGFAFAALAWILYTYSYKMGFWSGVAVVVAIVLDILFHVFWVFVININDDR
jgi:hypothetical protein